MPRSSYAFRALSGALIVAAACAVEACDSAPPTEQETSSTAQALAPTTTAWGGWGALGGGLVTDPSAVVYDKNHLGVVATHNSVFFNWFQVLNWRGWVDLGTNGNVLNSPPVAVRVGNNIEVFVVDTTAGTLLHKTGTFNGGSAPTFGPWETIWRLEIKNGLLDSAPALANNPRPPTVVISQPNNQINVFALFADGTTKLLRGSGFGSWQAWMDLSGGAQFQPAAVSWGPNRLDAFVVAGVGSQIYHRSSSDNGTTWSPAGGTWEAMGGVAASAPTAVSWGPSRVDLFVGGRPSGITSGVQHMAYNGFSGIWDDMNFPAFQTGLGGQMSPPTVITTGVGAINVFVQGIDQGLGTMAMTSVNPPTWGAYQEIAGCIRTGGTPAVVSPDNAALDLIVTGWAPDGNAGVYANSSNDGGAEFYANGISAPPACRCGGPNSSCCWPDNGCNDGAVCKASGATQTCQCDATHILGTKDGQPACVASGQLGESCNSDGSCTDPTAGCLAGQCVKRGVAGNPCRTDGTCDRGATCAFDNATPWCRPAGQPGEVCYDNGTCDPGDIQCMSNGWCQAKGAPGTQCKWDGSCTGPGTVCDSNQQCQACGNGIGSICCYDHGNPSANGGGPCGTGQECGLGGKCQAKPSCGEAGMACCTAAGVKPCIDVGATCTSKVCVDHKQPPPDPSGCGEISAPAAKCCHNKKPCVDSGVCNSFGDCAPANQSSACGTSGSVPVTICVTDDNGSEVYSGNWCSEAQATSFYTDWCKSVKTQYGYTKCDVGQPSGSCPP